MSKPETEAKTPVQLPENAINPVKASGKEERPGPYWRKARRLIILAGVPAVVLCVLLFLYFHNPNVENRYYLPCFFHKLTGLYCPGCGNTRALYALLHLDLFGMLRSNLLFPVLAVLLIWLLAGEYLKLLFGRRILWFPRKISPVIVIVFVAIVIAFAILRNLPFFPFTCLAPVS